MNNIIFLDIDGVLNYDYWYHSEEYANLEFDAEYDIDPKCVNLINKLCEECNASIVISSSWKINNYYKSRLERAGLKYILDKTPDLIYLGKGNYSRGEEIDLWLDLHKVDNYVIIDDVDAFTENQQLHFVKVNSSVGFDEYDYNLAKNILNYAK
jgi:hypothetical protein